MGKKCYNMGSIYAGSYSVSWKTQLDEKMIENQSWHIKSDLKWGGNYIMLAAVKGYYDGNQIIVDEEDRKSLNVGDEVIITILDRINESGVEKRAEKRIRLIESGAYVMPSGRTAEEINKYIKEMRSNDRG